MKDRWDHHKRYGRAYLTSYFNERPTSNTLLEEGQKVVRLTNKEECRGLTYRVISYEKFLEVIKITPVQILLIKEYFKK
jgi:hypothetical protein